MEYHLYYDNEIQIPIYRSANPATGWHTGTRYPTTIIR